MRDRMTETDRIINANIMLQDENNIVKRENEVLKRKFSNIKKYIDSESLEIDYKNKTMKEKMLEILDEVY